MLIAQEAADWFVANRMGLAGRERSAFAAWLKASPVHVEEYLAISVIARDLPAAREGSEASLDALLNRVRLEQQAPPRAALRRLFSDPSKLPSFKWKITAVTIAALSVVTLGMLALWSPILVRHTSVPEGAAGLRFATRHGEQQVHRLADGSTVHLNTDTSLTIRYDKTERLVTLTSGEAAFVVAHEPDRSFQVFAGQAQIVAVGTKFNVRLRRDSTVVTVLEGRVATGLSARLDRRGESRNPESLRDVVPAGAGRNPDSSLELVQVGAGQQISVADGEWPATPTAIDAQRATAWLHRQIAFEHEPLERVAAEFNRYAPKPIEIVTPALQHMEISGVFATDDTEAFIAFLRSLEGVRVEVTTARIRVSQD